jgi:hypothetical protein
MPRIRNRTTNRCIWTEDSLFQALKHVREVKMAIRDTESVKEL